MLIRAAVDADLDAILAIHNDAILNSTAIWDDDPVDRAERERWFSTRTRAGNAVLVADDGGTTAGYASYAPWRPKNGFRDTVEDSVYVGEGHRGRGVGRALLSELIDHARGARHHVMLADIESGNEASIRLHENFGFEHAAQLNEIGQKFGRWLDLTILALRLN